jgi:hypothetical protein
MEFRPTRMLNHGRVRPIVVEPITRRPLDKCQGGIAANSASIQTAVSTGGTSVLKSLAEAPAFARFLSADQRGPTRSSRHAQWLARRSPSLRFGSTGGTF